MSVSAQLQGNLPDESDQLCRIARHIREQSSSVSAAIIEIGRNLIKAKSIADHGAFGPWVETECGFTLRSAQNYMRVAAFADGKSEMVSLLSPGALYRLSAKGTPLEVVSTVLRVLEKEKGRVFSETEIDDMLALRRITLVPSQDTSESTPSDEASGLAAQLLRQIDPALARALVEGPWNLIGKRLRQHLSRATKQDDGRLTSGQNSGPSQPVDLVRDLHDDCFRPRENSNLCQPALGTDNHPSTESDQPPAPGSTDQPPPAEVDAKANSFDDGIPDFLRRG